MADSVKCHQEVKRDNDIKGPINSSNREAISDISKKRFSGAMRAEARLPRAEGSTATGIGMPSCAEATLIFSVSVQFW